MAAMGSLEWLRKMKEEQTMLVLDRVNLWMMLVELRFRERPTWREVMTFGSPMETLDGELSAGFEPEVQ